MQQHSDDMTGGEAADGSGAGGAGRVRGKRSSRRTAVRAAATAAVALTLASGTPAAPAARTAADTPVDGVWRVTGYGTVLSIADGRLREFRTTAAGCLPGDSAKETAPGKYLTADGTVVTVRAEGSLQVAGAAGDRALRRLPGLPSDCERPLPKDPLTAFDVFWQSFEAHYPFFAAKGVDWDAVRDEYRPRVTADMSRTELFDVLADMVRPLYDAHVTVTDGDRHFGQVRPGAVVPSPDLDTKIRNHIVRRDLHGEKPREFANGRIGYADLPNGQGYLRITGFTGYDTEDRTYAAQLAELDRALDAVFTARRTASLKGLVIDLRINGGGFDALGLRLAARLTDSPYLAYRTRTRYTHPQSVQVRPVHGVPRYTGPVAVLAGGTTVSAGETFVQALMDRPGGAVRIGENTQGVFSDVLEFRLPNGMEMGLPNEEFLTRSGRTFDGAGIPPHVRTPVFTEDEFTENRDSAFDAAVRILGQAGTP
ncbi:Peptidase family S41 [Streptomyces sp. YIM 130001]|uniref:S41 family peptidase n=1 Tax=Streptomyces sp. YIM 130001 TaxID=2259644 RepID=UPI000EC9EF2E|nr:S41 family peptidase [Streptomyces sp. YIM 130001]RII20544.1 Peptidase family S41 [Streptomyces sp. YIM 130001]